MRYKIYEIEWKEDALAKNNFSNRFIEVNGTLYPVHIESNVAEVSNMISKKEVGEVEFTPPEGQRMSKSYEVRESVRKLF